MRNVVLVMLLGVCAVTGLALAPASAPATGVVAAPGPISTLSQDLEELLLLIPMKPLRKLINRYLLNDAEFQGLVRVLNSQDAYILAMRFRSQPEVVAFHSWVRSQLLISGGGSSMELEDSAEFDLFNETPHWANTVYGLQGFFNEFLAYYPQDLLRSHINMKLTQNGSFAQMWARLSGLKVVYDRVLAFPEAQRLIAQLQAKGVDPIQLDQFIRMQLDWYNAVPNTAGNAPAPAPAAGSAVYLV